MGNPDGGRQTSLTLLQRLRANEPDAWGRLIALYRPLVVYWCDRQGVRGADAEDVCQEVFRVAAAKLSGFRRDRPGDTFRGWLRGITRNKLLAFRRDARDNPPGVGGTNVLYVLKDASQPENHGLPKDPAIPMSLTLWKGPLKWLGTLTLIGGILGTFLHYVRYGPRTYEGQEK